MVVDADGLTGTGDTPVVLRDTARGVSSRRVLLSGVFRTLFREPNFLYPNLFSMPYLSSVHWLPEPSTASASTTAALTPPWAAGATRPILMLFLGGVNHGDILVRTRLSEMCGSYHNKSICTHARYDANKTLLLKRKATFCLEPPGDTPYRRSFTDDIALGCIPVLFNRMQNHAYSWMWDGWREASRVLVPRGPFSKGQIDLFALLSSIPDHFRRRMQANIAAHGRKFQMSREDDPGDAVHMILQGAMRHRRRLQPSQSVWTRTCNKGPVFTDNSAAKR